MDQEEKRNPFINDKLARISRDAVALLGTPDRMLYLSKSMRKPTTIFNANVYNAGAEKIWYGDLEIERDREALIELSNREEAIYILWEMDGRFLKKAPTITYIKDRAIVTIENGAITYSPAFQRYVDFTKRRQKEKEKTGRQKRRR